MYHTGVHTWVCITHVSLTWLCLQLSRQHTILYSIPHSTTHPSVSFSSRELKHGISTQGNFSNPIMTLVILVCFPSVCGYTNVCFLHKRKKWSLLNQSTNLQVTFFKNKIFEILRQGKQTKFLVKRLFSYHKMANHCSRKCSSLNKYCV